MTLTFSSFHGFWLEVVYLNTADLPFSVTPALAELRLHTGRGVNKDMKFDEYKQQIVKQYKQREDTLTCMSSFLHKT